ncbi:MAG: lactate racemase domain-containing protein, partial [Deltaproteobacteria bacterium]
MTTLRVPFETAEERGTHLELNVPDKNLVRSFIPEEPPPLVDVGEAARYAVENPLGSKPLSALVRPGMRV